MAIPLKNENKVLLSAPRCWVYNVVMSSYFSEHDCSSGEVPNHFLDLARLIAIGGYWEQVGLQYTDLFGHQPPPPTAKAVIAALKTSIIKEGEGGQCAVCLKPYEAGETVKQLPCKHTFHSTCIVPWLEKTNSCPMCRHELKTDDAIYEEYKNRQKGEAERKSQLESLHDSMFS